MSSQYRLNLVRLSVNFEGNLGTLTTNDGSATNDDSVPFSTRFYFG